MSFGIYGSERHVEFVIDPNKQELAIYKLIAQNQMTGGQSKIQEMSQELIQSVEAVQE